MKHFRGFLRTEIDSPLLRIINSVENTNGIFRY